MFMWTRSKSNFLEKYITLIFYESKHIKKKGDSGVPGTKGEPGSKGEKGIKVKQKS